MPAVGTRCLKCYRTKSLESKKDVRCEHKSQDNEVGVGKSRTKHVLCVMLLIILHCL